MFKKIYINPLTGHVKSNGNRIGFVKPSACVLCVVKLTLFSPSTGVHTSPNVQLDAKSILAWYVLRHTRNRVWHVPMHLPLSSDLPLQHSFTLSLPLSLLKCFSRSSNRPRLCDCAGKRRKWFELVFFFKNICFS